MTTTAGVLPLDITLPCHGLCLQMLQESLAASDAAKSDFVPTHAEHGLMPESELEKEYDIMIERLGTEKLPYSHADMPTKEELLQATDAGGHGIEDCLDKFKRTLSPTSFLDQGRIVELLPNPWLLRKSKKCLSQPGPFS